MDDTAPVEQALRAHQLGSKVIDFTHDTLPETNWKPIEKTFDRVPPQFYLEEKSKTLLKEWEAEQHAEHYKFVYDRRGIDVDVFKPFQINGDVIKNTIDHKELMKDKGFWKKEEELQ